MKGYNKMRRKKQKRSDWALGGQGVKVLNGDVELAKNLISAAKESGADAVKFQTFKAEMLASQLTPKVQYQIENTGSSESHFQMLQKLELSFEDHFYLKAYCDSLDIEFISTPYDINSATFLNDELDVSFFKTASIPSFSMVFKPFLETFNFTHLFSFSSQNL